MANRDENAVRVQISRSVAIGARYPHPSHTTGVTQDLVKNPVPLNFDISGSSFFHKLVDHDRLGAKTIAAMNDCHRSGNVTQVQCLFDSGIAPTHNCNVLAAVEKSVAGCAADTPLPKNVCSDGMPRYVAEAPVEIISASH